MDFSWMSKHVTSLILIDFMSVEEHKKNSAIFTHAFNCITIIKFSLLISTQQTAHKQNNVKCEYS